jgi:hypothetical protein
VPIAIIKILTPCLTRVNTQLEIPLCETVPPVVHRPVFVRDDPTDSLGVGSVSWEAYVKF